MSTLPHPNSLSLFRYRNAGGNLVALMGKQPYPREIDDYVLDATKWTAMANPSVNKVLRADPKKCKLECESCDGKTRECDGQACITHFHNIIAPAGRAYLDIRQAGDLGWGVFARTAIPYGTVLGEYLGELVPRGQIPARDQYGFDYEVAGCTGRRYGNITRFVNHHCKPNVIVEQSMYGKRLVMLFKTDEQVDVGDQVFINYGRDYFADLGIQCKCDNEVGAHLPPGAGAGAGANNAAAKQGGAKKGAAKKGAAKAMAKKTSAKKAAAAAQKTPAKKTTAKKAAAKKAAGSKAAGKKAAGGKLTKAAGVKKK